MANRVVYSVVAYASSSGFQILQTIKKKILVLLPSFDIPNSLYNYRVLSLEALMILIHALTFLLFSFNSFSCVSVFKRSGFAGKKCDGTKPSHLMLIYLHVNIHNVSIYIKF